MAEKLYLNSDPTLPDDEKSVVLAVSDRVQWTLLDGPIAGPGLEWTRAGQKYWNAHTEDGPIGGYFQADVDGLRRTPENTVVVRPLVAPGLGGYTFFGLVSREYFEKWFVPALSRVAA